uniref:Uncharacterized protein n=1 Tax=Anguilla anguilla TaxID=7936 RepID=A0A0E9V0L7_ANGAN
MTLYFQKRDKRKIRKKI